MGESGEGEVNQVMKKVRVRSWDKDEEKNERKGEMGIGGVEGGKY